LLVVIVILGILSAVVVFSVRGIADTSKANTCAAERATLTAAVETYSARNGVTAIPFDGASGQTPMDTLRLAGFSNSNSKLYTVATDGTLTAIDGVANGCGASTSVTTTATTTATTVSTVTTVAAPVVCPTTIAGWKGEYYLGIALAGPMKLCRDDAAVDFDWGVGGPEGVATERFSVRWTRTQYFAAGTYTFALGSDDGSRLYIDGVLVLDRWLYQSYPVPQPTVASTLSAGNHTIVMEYFESSGNARATLHWQ
jgi:type II secretory pathway pseudopilin PulG